VARQLGYALALIGLLAAGCSSDGTSSRLGNDLSFTKDGPAEDLRVTEDASLTPDLSRLAEDLLAGGPDFSQVTLFRLAAGVYKVSGPVAALNDGCLVDPNNAMNPTDGLTWALTNDGAGNIRLNNSDNPNTPNQAQQYGPEVGSPPQPALGTSCPGINNPAQCASEPNARPFNNNSGTLVRDNTVSTGNCTFRRHVVNEVTLTADSTFTAAYTRRDTQHVGCMPAADCESTWTWKFVYVKRFGQ